MTRRPLMYVSSAGAAGILITYYLGRGIAFILILVLLIIFLFNKSPCRRIVFLILACYALNFLNFVCYQSVVDEAMLHIGDTAEINGKVIYVENKETSQGKPYIQLKIAAEEINGLPLENNSRILVKYYNAENRQNEKEPLVPGKQTIINGKLEIPTVRRNPRCFDYSLYLESIGIKTVLTATSIEVKEGSNKFNLSGELHIIKEKFLYKMENSVGKETAGMMRAIMFGEKSDLDKETLEEFQKNGTAHILAVSGLHIGIIYGFICMLWRWRKGRLFFVLVMTFFFCYMILAAFSPSVVRAVFMVGLHIFAKMTNRRYDLSSAAFLVITIMLVKNPMSIFNVGFQMSFLAVLTLALILPIIKRFYSGIFIGSLAIQLGLIPYTAYVFNYLSLAAVFINVPVIFLTGLLVPLGLCLMVFAELSEALFDLAAKLIFGVSEILKYINSLTEIDGITVFSVVSPNIKFLAVYYLCMLIFVSEEGRLMFLRKKKKTIVCCAISIAVAAFTFGYAADDGFKAADLVFVDVGQGDCMHIKTEDGMNYLIDGGGSINYNIGKKTLRPYLLKNGVKAVDAAFVTHLHTDHYQGIAELCKEGMIKKLFLYEGNRVKEGQILKETGLVKEDLIYLCKGQQVSLGENACVEVLWPERQGQSQYEKLAEDEADENLSSLILKVTINGNSMIATGDVDEACQDELAEIWKTQLNTDILKVAHHGSKYSYSEAFVNITKPEFVIFQVGKNNFGHPNEDVIANYSSKGIKIYRNDLNGAIGFDFRQGEKTGIAGIVCMIHK